MCDLLAEHTSRNSATLSDRTRFLFQVLARTLKSLDTKGLVKVVEDLVKESFSELMFATAFVIMNMKHLPAVPTGIQSFVSLCR